MVQLSTPWGDP